MTTHEDWAKQAKSEGKIARMTDATADNPYPLGTLEHKFWAYGWCAEDYFIKKAAQARHEKEGRS